MSAQTNIKTGTLKLGEWSREELFTLLWLAAKKCGPLKVDPSGLSISRDGMELLTSVDPAEMFEITVTAKQRTRP